MKTLAVILLLVLFGCVHESTQQRNQRYARISAQEYGKAYVLIDGCWYIMVSTDYQSTAVAKIDCDCIPTTLEK